MTWIEWFCSLAGNDCLCNVPCKFIADPTNYYGLDKIVPNYKSAFKVLVGEITEKKNIDPIEDDVITLYYLFHQRYIFSEDGLSDMKKKYQKQVYGICPRYFCDHVPLIPMGFTTQMRENGIMLYCPCCKDVYVPPKEEVAMIDGCAYGPNFPMEFLMHYPQYLQVGPLVKYEAKLYGMSISKESPAYREGRFSEIVE